jgi:hypothetical protein
MKTAAPKRKAEAQLYVCSNLFENSVHSDDRRGSTRPMQGGDSSSGVCQLLAAIGARLNTNHTPNVINEADLQKEIGAAFTSCDAAGGGSTRVGSSRQPPAHTAALSGLNPLESVLLQQRQHHCTLLNRALAALTALQADVDNLLAHATLPAFQKTDRVAEGKEAAVMQRLPCADDGPHNWSLVVWKPPSALPESMSQPLNHANRCKVSDMLPDSGANSTCNDNNSETSAAQCCMRYGHTSTSTCMEQQLTAVHATGTLSSSEPRDNLTGDNVDSAGGCGLATSVGGGTASSGVNISNAGSSKSKLGMYGAAGAEPCHNSARNDVGNNHSACGDISCVSRHSSSSSTSSCSDFEQLLLAQEAAAAGRGRGRGGDPGRSSIDCMDPDCAEATQARPSSLLLSTPFLLSNPVGTTSCVQGSCSNITRGVVSSSCNSITVQPRDEASCCSKVKGSVCDTNVDEGKESGLQGSNAQHPLVFGRVSSIGSGNGTGLPMSPRNIGTTGSARLPVLFTHDSIAAVVQDSSIRVSLNTCSSSGTQLLPHISLPGPMEWTATLLLQQQQQQQRQEVDDEEEEEEKEEEEDLEQQQEQQVQQEPLLQQQQQQQEQQQQQQELQQEPQQYDDDNKDKDKDSMESRELENEVDGCSRPLLLLQQPIDAVAANAPQSDASQGTVRTSSSRCECSAGCGSSIVTVSDCAGGAHAAALAASKMAATAVHGCRSYSGQRNDTGAHAAQLCNSVVQTELSALTDNGRLEMWLDLNAAAGGSSSRGSSRGSNCRSNCGKVRSSILDGDDRDGFHCAGGSCTAAGSLSTCVGGAPVLGLSAVADELQQAADDTSASDMLSMVPDYAQGMASMSINTACETQGFSCTKQLLFNTSRPTARAVVGGGVGGATSCCVGVGTTAAATAAAATTAANAAATAAAAGMSAQDAMEQLQHVQKAAALALDLARAQEDAAINVAATSRTVATGLWAAVQHLTSCPWPPAAEGCSHMGAGGGLGASPSASRGSSSSLHHQSADVDGRCRQPLHLFGTGTTAAHACASYHGLNTIGATTAAGMEPIWCAHQSPWPPITPYINASTDPHPSGAAAGSLGTHPPAPGTRARAAHHGYHNTVLPAVLNSACHFGLHNQLKSVESCLETVEALRQGEDHDLWQLKCGLQTESTSFYCCDSDSDGNCTSYVVGYMNRDIEPWPSAAVLLRRELLAECAAEAAYCAVLRAREADCTAEVRALAASIAVISQ